MTSGLFGASLERQIIYTIEPLIWGAALRDQFEIVNALANRDSELRRIDDAAERLSALLPFLRLA